MSAEATPAGNPEDSTQTVHAAGAGPDTAIGPYTLLRRIGEGGMGVVYFARQREPIRRDVALKIIKPGMDSRQVIARFEGERQALAVMDHPNVARALDAGATAAGLPYFVMEFVDGVPITRYCDSKGLTVRQRIELLIPVCKAIQHAHQKGIIHRDIKPANILVAEQEGKPVPKVIDFGLAKALGGALSDATIMTNLGTVVGTLEYMSPEQASLTRQDVDTRTDIYSLGAVLYELLTGTTPLGRCRAADAGYIEALRRIRDEETAPPSTRLRRSGSSAEIAAQRRTDAARLPTLLRGELDWIAMKALEKDRTRRYETVNALARDLERYLGGEPVEAAPPSASYRMSKFVRKHRPLIAVGLTFTALLVAGITVSTMESRRAQRRFAQVRELASTFLFRFYDEVSPLAGSTAARADIVDTARKYLDGLAAEAAGDRDLQFELAQAYYRLGRAQSGVGRSGLAQVEDARKSFRRSIELFDRLGVSPGAPAALRREAARTLVAWGELEWGGSHPDAAIPLADRAMALTEQGADREPGMALLRAQAELNLGEARFLQGRTAEALALYDRGAQRLQDFQAQRGVDADMAQILPTLRHRAARARARLGDLDGALAVFEEDLKTQPDCDLNHPAPQQCRDLAILLSWSGDVYGALDRPNLGQPDRAAPLYERSMTIFEALVRADPKDGQARYDLAARHGKLADVIWRRDPARAMRLYEEAMNMARALASPEMLQALRESYLTAISRPLILMSRTAEARRALTEAHQTIHAPENYDDRLSDIELDTLWARLLNKEGKADEARSRLRTAIHNGEDLRSSHPDDLRPVYFLSNAYRELAGLTSGVERRQALIGSATAWGGWPAATAYTKREEQSDRAVAER